MESELKAEESSANRSVDSLEPRKVNKGKFSQVNPEI